MQRKLPISNPFTFKEIKLFPMSFTSTYLNFPSNCVFSTFIITGNAENAQPYLKFVRFFHNIDYNFLARCFFRYHNYNVWHGILLGSIQCSSLKTAFLLA